MGSLNHDVIGLGVRSWQLPICLVSLLKLFLILYSSCLLGLRTFFWSQGFSLLTLLIYTGCWIGRLFFAKRISPGQNGDELFGERNFMQPMGRPKHAHKVPCFFPFKFGAGRGRIFFHLSLVPNVFSPCSR